MAIVFDSAAVRQINRSFGRGLARYAGQHANVPFTAADAAWAAQTFGDLEAARVNRHFDRLAGESAFMDRHERGYCS